MTAKILYRTAAVLLGLFAVLHTVGFAQVDPTWGLDALLAQIRQATFVVQGQTRTHWDFFYGLGLSVTVWQVLAIAVAWELGNTQAALPLLRWGLVLVTAGIAAVSWRYLFPAPVIFAVLISGCLVLALWRTQQESASGVR
ncbi:MAG: hypothetical protein U0133_17150 [Gemmatimonadales bacterium]